MKRSLRLHVSLAAALLATAFVLVVQGQAFAAAAVWYVSPSGSDSNSCAVAASPCLTIDGAISKAAARDTVEVAVGTYTGTGTVIVTIDRDLTLSGGWNGTFTQQTGLSTIDGQNERQDVYVASTATAAATRLEVMNGTPTLGPADPAGGVALDGPLTLDHSYIHDNAGGVWTDGPALTITNSTISGNQMGVGLSSLAVFGTFTITITDSTIAKNTDTGIFLPILSPSSSVLRLNFDTISGNSGRAGDPNSGGGVTVNTGWDVEMKNSIVSANTGYFSSCNDICVQSGSSVTSGGYNIGGGFTHTGTDSYEDPVLDSLADNGGPTPTIGLLGGSPAIDAIPPGVNGCGTTIAIDQRDVTRPWGRGCDIGAVELDQPPNDDFVDAQDISGPVGIVDGWTLGGTKEPGEPNHAGDPGGASIWYQWTASGSGKVTFSTDGSDFDTLLAAYTGTDVAHLTAVASNDDAHGLLTSEISFNAIQGTTYSIAIDGAGGDSGLSELSWDLQPPNDNFAAAQILSGDHGSVDGTTVGATKEPGEPNHAGDPGGSSVWYRWTAPATGTLALDTCTSDFDTLLGVYTGPDVAHLATVASNDDGPPTCGPDGQGSQVTLPVTVGTTYEIAVDGFDGDWGNFALAWTRTSPPPPPPQPPTNTALPTIAGSPKPGQTLTAAPGTWTGTAPIGYAYQWDSCDGTGASCADISGQTASTYLVSSADAGSTFRVVVTASNAAGHAAATSIPTAAVPIPQCLVPKLKGTTVTRARTLLRHAHCALGRVSYTESHLLRGRIVSERPRAGASGPSGTKVRVVVSRGPRRS